MNRQILRDLGLSGNEVEIYLALLRYGPCPASRIVSATSLNRTHVYDRIEKMLEKGIANYVIKENTKYFNVISPGNLLNYIGEKRKNLEETEKNLLELIPELEKIKKADEGVAVEVFKGIEGVKTILNHVVESGKDLRVFPITGIMYERLPIFYRNYLKRTEKAGIKRYLLASEDKRVLRYEKAPLTKVRYLPGKFNFPSSTWIYGDFVIIFVVAGELTLIRIQSKSAAQVYTKFFNTFWKMSAN